MTRSVEECVADLSSPDGITRDQALAMLVSYGTRATAALLPLLDGDDPELRARAASGLAYIADPSSADRLFRSLDDRDPRVRSQSAWGLFRMRDPRALDALVKTIDDYPHPTMTACTLSSDALVAMGEPALPRVAELLASPSVETRRRARLVILTVAPKLAPDEAAKWRERVAAAERA